MSGERLENLAAACPAATAPNLNALWSRVLVDELVRSGLEQVVISPGSRSAPLVFQFAAHPEVRDHSVIDERSAAWFALGLARAGGKPVALLCTTGTAAANYFPAICEAERDRIPLLVLTAARPPEDHDCGVQQVMNQTCLYGSHARAFHALPLPELAAGKLAAVRALMARAWHQTRFPQAGPVHLDIPFRKPLEPVTAAPGQPGHVPTGVDAETTRVINGRDAGRPWLQIDAPVMSAMPEQIESLAALIDASHRPLIVAGASAFPTKWREPLRKLAEAAAIPVLASPQSGLRHWRGRGANLLASGDLLAGGGFYLRQPAPDLVLHLGSAPLGWALQDLLGCCQTATHVVISDSGHLDDPEHCADLQLIAEPGNLFVGLHARVGPPPDARRRWLAAHQRAETRSLARLRELLDPGTELSAPGAWNRIGRILPAGSALVTSSSMVVRDLDCFMAAAGQDLEVHFNRGLNGIDGVVATALGVAAARKLRGKAEPTLLVIGDIALRHDLGALPLAAELGLDLTVVVIDNDGGEIFDYLPGVAFPQIHRRHFTTALGRPVTDLLPRSIDWEAPESLPALADCLTRSLHASGLRVIRVATRRPHDRRLRDAISTEMQRLHSGGNLAGT